MKKESAEQTILIVDDTAQNISILSELLSGFKIKVAINGEKALDILHNCTSKEIDLILLDVNMPVMDGFKTCKLIRENEKHEDTPIIFLTAKNNIESIIKGFELGAQDYVAHPFNEKELLARINTQLELKSNREKMRNFNKLLEEQVVSRTEELTRALNKLSVLEKAKNDFLTIISHELRTPLTGICGYAESLKNLEETELSREFLDRLITDANRLLKFSETALKITELKTGKINFAFEQIAIVSLVEYSLLSAKGGYQNKNINVKTDFPGKEFYVDGDYVLLGKCFDNIFDNAFKFSPENSTVYIKITKTDDNIEITISDEGPGFNDFDLIQRFEMFYSGDAAHHQTGFGLSLAESKLIIDAHNGKIEGNNSKRGGAEVKVILPVITIN